MTKTSTNALPTPSNALPTPLPTRLRNPYQRRANDYQRPTNGLATHPPYPLGRWQPLEGALRPEKELAEKPLTASSATVAFADREAFHG
jgi:hypothetical protein